MAARSPALVNYAIVKYLKDYQQTLETGGDVWESLEVGIQCLQTVFGIDTDDPSQMEVLTAQPNLKEMFQGPPSALDEKQMKERAEAYKVQGNAELKKGNIPAAGDLYSKAIELDPTNAIFYCNRALTHSKMDDYDAAVADCKKSIELDPNYSRAYLRLGHMYMHQKKHALAKETYEQALARDLDNGEIRGTLEAIEREMRAPTAGSEPTAPEGAPRGNLDFRSILSNPSFMRMASAVMANPTFRSMTDNVISQMNAEPSQTSSTAEPTASAPQGNMLSQFHAVAEQIRQQDPQLLESLRSEVASAASGSSQAEGRDKQEKDQDSHN